jgi:hypothetical protein
MPYDIKKLVYDVCQLHPPNCDCAHEACGEIARALLEAWARIDELEKRLTLANEILALNPWLRDVVVTNT